MISLLPPELAHNLTLGCLQLGLGGCVGKVCPGPHLRKSLWGLSFPSPLGMAAGFDKNGTVITLLLRLGLGFVEVGTITPLPQPGNPKPRVFRIPEQQSLVNRYGFNSQGYAKVHARLSKWREDNPEAILGINLGMNRDVKNPIPGYKAGVRLFESIASYLVINLSSPNTPGLRYQQGAKNLSDLIRRLQDSRKGRTTTPILLKLSPDLIEPYIDRIAETARATSLDGLVLGNTSRMIKGGLSGALLTAKAQSLLEAFHSRLQGSGVHLIGVGGIMNGEDARRRIESGADLVQVYTGLVYRGRKLLREIYYG